MPYIFKPTTIERHFTTSTTQGEVTVNINLTLKLEVGQDGEIKVAATAAPEAPQIKTKKPEFSFQIPDFESEQLIEFGRDAD